MEVIQHWTDYVFHYMGFKGLTLLMGHGICPCYSGGRFSNLLPLVRLGVRFMSSYFALASLFILTLLMLYEQSVGGGGVICFCSDDTPKHEHLSVCVYRQVCMFVHRLGAEVATRYHSGSPDPDPLSFPCSLLPL